MDRWKCFLRGLWWSGRRLGEGLAQSWDTTEPFCIWDRAEFPTFRIVGEAQKNRKCQFLPLAPDLRAFTRYPLGQTSKTAGIAKTDAAFETGDDAEVLR